ncbi:MAG: hypothetical protein PHZ09_11500 [Eubacteriales bacterium]|jgi:hypothetical protein|nr:hypothetical protein [Eubacteriales bacterium]
MIKYLKKAICIVLACCFVFPFFACADSGPAAETASQNETGTSITEPEETSPEFNVPSDLDFGGRDFVILACDEKVPYTYIELAEQNGEVINDAVYERNILTEDRLGVTLKVSNVEGIVTETPLRKSVTSGDMAYDLVSPHILQSVSALVTGSLIRAFNEVPYIDFDKPWWNQSFTETMKIKGRIFYSSGDIIVPNARVIVFNKQMMADFNKEDIYEAVRTGKWTLDMLGEYTKDMADEDSGRYAFSDLSNTGLATSFVHASDMLFLEVSDDSFRFTLADEKMDVIINKLNDYLYREGSNKITNEDFGNGNVLFGSQVLLKLQILRAFDTDFGIIPFPKYDEAQAGYYSSVWNGLLCIPVDVSDIECTGAVLETMGYYSSKILVPAYYEKLLDSKFSRDEESGEMLDIIFGGLIYDFGLCFDNFMGNYAAPGTLLNSGSVDLASFFAKNEKKYTDYYQGIFDAIDAG